MDVSRICRAKEKRTVKSREYTVNPVVMPEESFGICKNSKNCHTYNAWLAWKLCASCYDRRVDGIHRAQQKKKNSKRGKS